MMRRVAIGLLAIAATVLGGYRATQAVDLKRESKALFGPRGGAGEAVFGGSLSLSVLHDPTL